MLCPLSWPKMFTEFKKVAQEAKNYLKIRKWNWEDLHNENFTKQVRFDHLPPHWEWGPPSPYQEQLAQIRAPNNLPLVSGDKVASAELH